jgi:hypothetical protein
VVARLHSNAFRTEAMSSSCVNGVTCPLSISASRRSISAMSPWSIRSVGCRSGSTLFGNLGHDVLSFAIFGRSQPPDWERTSLKLCFDGLSFAIFPKAFLQRGHQFSMR